jgi:hypothetical protein
MVKQERSTYYRKCEATPTLQRHLNQRRNEKGFADVARIISKQQLCPWHGSRWVAKRLYNPTGWYTGRLKFSCNPRRIRS